MSEIEKLRALLAEAQHALRTNDDEAASEIASRIDSALAEPVEGCAECARWEEYDEHFQREVNDAVQRERDEARAEVERLSAALWAVRRAWSGRDASCDWGLHKAIEGDAADALHGGSAAAANVERAITEAYKRGAEAMREAAARAEPYAYNLDDHLIISKWRAIIRALPVPEDKQ